MGIEVMMMSDCASNYGIFEVRGSRGTYNVVLTGSEGPARCTCPAFKYSGSRQTCKHVDLVLREACLYNPQWHAAKDAPTISIYRVHVHCIHRPRVCLRRANGGGGEGGVAT